jgi:site-specific DNA-methyltransferase (adenine-specific)
MELTNEDNMELMSRYEDNYFDLAIVDPPYGIDANLKRGDTGKNKHIKQKDYHVGDWDSEIPSAEYFKELKRVSKNQIIWGGNYFLDYLNNTSCMIVWDKVNGTNYYADCELAWTSFKTSVRKFEWRWHGFLQQNMANKQDRIHPTEKPISLYEWLLMNYAKEGDKILDTHLGSGSIALACHNLKYDLTACELDTEYYNAAMKRLKQHQQQLTIFDI